MHNLNGLATSPRESRYIKQQPDSKQLRYAPSQFSEHSFQTKFKSLKAMPLPEKEYTWKDGLRGQTSSHTKNSSIGCTSRNMSFMSVPMDISKIEGSFVHERLYKENFELRKKREELYDPNRKERIAEQTFSFSPNRHKNSN